jgi:hypothetical protein
MIAENGRATQALTVPANQLGTPLDTSSLTAPMVLGPPPTFRQYVAGALQRLGIFIAGADNGRALFPPQQPLQPIAQPADFAALGRSWDYPVGWNTRVTPRSGMPIAFSALKEFATYDLLRILIERVKDKIVTQRWAFMPKDREAKRDTRSDQLEEFYAYPDKVHSWADWVRMLLEQMLVYDAPAVWLRPTRGGALYSLEILDGSLITPKIMPDGRLPPPDFGPAYQQVLKGLPAIDYIQPVPKGSVIPKDPSGQPFPELLYKPSNPRVDSVYGYSRVEQIIASIGIGLKREEFLSLYYTSGSLPDMLIGVPDTWQPNQIAQMQALFDSLLAGNLEQRRRARFVPGGLKPYELKAELLKDETDEWLIRIMCFSLGLNPMPFVKQMNRGQEKTHHQEAAEEGMEPIQAWLRDFFGAVNAIKFGVFDLEFTFIEDEAVEPLEAAQVDQILLSTKVYHPDEIRQKRGDDPMSDDMRAQMDQPTFSASPNATVLPPDQQQEADDRAKERAALAPKPVPGGPGAPVGKSRSVGARLRRSMRTGVRY